MRVVQDGEIRFWSVVNTVQDAKDFLLGGRSAILSVQSQRELFPGEKDLRMLSM